RESDAIRVAHNVRGIIFFMRSFLKKGPANPGLSYPDHPFAPVHRCACEHFLPAATPLRTEACSPTEPSVYNEADVEPLQSFSAPLSPRSCAPGRPARFLRPRLALGPPRFHPHRLFLEDLARPGHAAAEVGHARSSVHPDPCD